METLHRVLQKNLVLGDSKVPYGKKTELRDYPSQRHTHATLYYKKQSLTVGSTNYRLAKKKYLEETIINISMLSYACLFYRKNKR